LCAKSQCLHYNQHCSDPPLRADFPKADRERPTFNAQR
jgi:hypothetical protein